MNFPIRIWLCLSWWVTLPLYADVTLGPRSFEGWHSSYQKPSDLSCPAYCQEINLYSSVLGVPSNLILSVIKQESNFNPNAVSPKGAKGLMQLMDINSRAANINPFEPEANIREGTRLLARLIGKYDQLELALAAYNAGEGNVDKYGRIPPFPETQQYVRKVLAHYNWLNLRQKRN